MYVELVDDINGFNVLASFEADVMPAPGDMVTFYPADNPENQRQRGIVSKRNFVNRGPDYEYRVDCVIELVELKFEPDEGYTV